MATTPTAFAEGPAARCGIRGERHPQSPGLRVEGVDGLSIVVTTLVLWQLPLLINPSVAQTAMSFVLSLFLIGVLVSLDLAYRMVNDNGQRHLPRLVCIFVDALRKDEELSAKFGGQHTVEENVKVCKDIVRLWSDVLEAVKGVVVEMDVDAISKERLQPWKNRLSEWTTKQSA